MKNSKHSLFLQKGKPQRMEVRQTEKYRHQYWIKGPEFGRNVQGGAFTSGRGKDEIRGSGRGKKTINQLIPNKLYQVVGIGALSPPRRRPEVENPRVQPLVTSRYIIVVQ